MGREMHRSALQSAVRESIPDSDVMHEYEPLFDLQQQLGEYLRSLLPAARLRRQLVLPEHDLGLWLIDPEGMDVPLEHGEAAAVFAEPPYWCFCWGSGVALARRILAAPEHVRGRSVLDLGCGSGVAAIAAAMAGARRVIACDLDPWALQAARLNAADNGVELELLSDFDELDDKVDVLMAADVLYDWENRPLLQSFRQAATEVWLADSRVANFSEPGYQAEAQERAVTLPDLGESETVKNVRFYRAFGHADAIASALD